MNVIGIQKINKRGVSPTKNNLIKKKKITKNNEKQYSFAGWVKIKADNIVHTTSSAGRIFI